jgi:hypothetical protein
MIAVWVRTAARYWQSILWAAGHTTDRGGRARQSKSCGLIVQTAILLLPDQYRARDPMIVDCLSVSSTASDAP